MMKLSDFDYYLPKNMIAQTPTPERDKAKLLKLDIGGDSIEHLVFGQVTDLLKPGDVLVVNDSRVVNARLFGHKSTGGKVELLILEPHELDISPHAGEKQVIAECLVKGKVRPGMEIRIDPGASNRPDLYAHVLEKAEGGKCRIEFESDGPLVEVFSKYGYLPLPPYIKKDLKAPDRYQTVYSKNNGSVAAPTAGLHFTPELLRKLENKGVEIVYLTLHISYGTFTPVRTENIVDHRMDREYAILTRENAARINRARASRQGRLVAVGTTTVRTLETAARNSISTGGIVKEFEPWSGWTDLFIYPGFEFRAGIDILITNFHLPRSTLLMLVSAFAGKENILKAYQEAIDKKYRFYSLGDAMMIIR